MNCPYTWVMVRKALPHEYRMRRFGTSSMPVIVSFLRIVYFWGIWVQDPLSN